MDASSSACRRKPSTASRGLGYPPGRLAPSQRGAVLFQARMKTTILPIITTVMLLLNSMAPGTQAATITVTSTADSGPGSLRDVDSSHTYQTPGCQ